MPRADGVVASYHEENAALSPLVVATLKAMLSFSPAAFKTHLKDFFPLLTNLIRCAGVLAGGRAVRLATYLGCCWWWHTHRPPARLPSMPAAASTPRLRCRGRCRRSLPAG